MTILVVGLATFEEMAGGSARYLSGLVGGLRELGHDVTVVTAARHVATVGYSEHGWKGQLRRTTARFLLVLPRTFLSVLRLRPDVVNSHFALDGLPAVLAAWLVRVPVVVTFHGPWALEAIATGRRGRWPLSTFARKRIERFVYRRAQRCVVLSRAFGELLVSEYGVDPERVSVIPGGLDTNQFQGLPAAPQARHRLGLPERYTIATVRRLVPRMGLDLAIGALAEVAADMDAQLVIAGTGPDRERLEGLARQLGLEDRVRFLGRLPETDLGLLYAAADVCVVPSRELEGFGYVALEALAAGAPVVAVGTGGLAELVGGLEPGWVVAGDASSIAGAVRRLVAAPDVGPGREARQAYAATMDWANIAPRVVEVLHTAMGVQVQHRR